MQSHLAHHIFEIAHRGDITFSDIHLEQGHPVMARTPSGWKPTGFGNDVTSTDLVGLLKDFDPSWESKMDGEKHFEGAKSDKGVRLRCSAYSVENGLRVAVSIRKLPREPLSLDKLGLPPSVDSFAEATRGLLLVCGPTGAGKTTTLAAIIRRINETRAAHILTIEDPIEYVFEWNKAIISQRAVGTDVDSFAQGLHGALRQRPDVILIGEIRDRETAETALRAAESGHFVMATTHARNASTAISRFLAFFGDEDRVSKSQALASSLVGVIAQTLPATPNGKATLAAEVLHVRDPQVVKAIAEQKFGEVDELLRAGKVPQSTDLNTVLFKKVKAGEISAEAAFSVSPRADDLRQTLHAAR